MGHQIEYIIDLPGAEASQILAITFRTTQTEEDEGYVWDAVLPNSDMGFTAVLPGFVTILGLAEKYSHFISYADAKERVLTWEKELQKFIPPVKLVRIDEFLQLQWMSTVGEDWYRDQSRCSEFFRWIETQDKEYWAYI